MIKVIKILIEILGWLSIAICPTIVAGVISLIVYYKLENATLSLAILIAGFFIGAIWATKISIRYGAAEWISQIRKVS